MKIEKSEYTNLVEKLASEILGTTAEEQAPVTPTEEEKQAAEYNALVEKVALEILDGGDFEKTASTAEYSDAEQASIEKAASILVEAQMKKEAAEQVYDEASLMSDAACVALSAMGIDPASVFSEE